MLSMALNPTTISIKPTNPFLKTTYSKLPINKNQIFAKPIKPIPIFSISAAATATVEDSVEIPPEIEKHGVVVKPMEKPRLVLKFIWMEKNIGLALDQVIPGHGTIPLSPYYIWPRKDAWEELKVLLETKPWISQKQMIILLNQATDIINLWQQSGGDLS